MKTYLARQDLRTIKRVLTIPMTLLTLTLTLLIVDALRIGQPLPIGLSLTCLVGMAIGAANILSFHRQQSSWLMLTEQGLRYGHGHQQRALPFEGVLGLSAARSGQALTVISAQGTMTIDLVFERSDELVRQLIDTLTPYHCTLDTEALEAMQHNLQRHGQLPSLSNVLGAAAFGSMFMLGFYAIFTQVLPYLI